jgi:putative sigma-54 modulation protein
MNITITSRKFKARETLKEFIRDEVSALERFNDRISGAEVILSYQGIKDSIKSVEIILRIPGQTLTATEMSDDYQKSTVAVIEKIESQLGKIKQKALKGRNV